jgi:hypothetical protein
MNLNKPNVGRKQMSDRIFYTYAYLREDGTPYYVGRGKGRRAFSSDHRVKVPPKEKILFLKKDLTYSESVDHEIYMIAVLGRKDLGTGILRNMTDGGEGAPGRIKSPEEIEAIRKANIGKTVSIETRQKVGKAKRGVPIHSEEEKMRQKERWKINNPNADGSSVRGKKSWTNGVENITSFECPGDGWFLGRTSSKRGETHSEEQKKAWSEERKKRKHWVNSTGGCKFQSEHPGDGWTPGRKWRDN